MYQINLLHLEILTYNHHDQVIIYYTSINNVEYHTFSAQATIFMKVIGLVLISISQLYITYILIVKHNIN